MIGNRHLGIGSGAEASSFSFTHATTGSQVYQFAIATSTGYFIMVDSANKRIPSTSATTTYLELPGAPLYTTTPVYSSYTTTAGATLTRVFSTDSAGTPVGTITQLNFNYAGATPLSAGALDISKCAKSLTFLSMGGHTQVSSVTGLSNCVALKELRVNSCAFTSLDCTPLTELLSVEASNQSTLTSFTTNAKLKNIYLANCNITTTDPFSLVKGSLENLNCSNNQNLTVGLSGHTKLKTVNISACKLSGTGPGATHLPRDNPNLISFNASNSAGLSANAFSLVNWPGGFTSQADDYWPVLTTLNLSNNFILHPGYIAWSAWGYKYADGPRNTAPDYIKLSATYQGVRFQSKGSNTLEPLYYGPLSEQRYFFGIMKIPKSVTSLSLGGMCVGNQTNTFHDYNQTSQGGSRFDLDLTDCIGITDLSACFDTNTSGSLGKIRKPPGLYGAPPQDQMTFVGLLTLRNTGITSLNIDGTVLDIFDEIIIEDNPNLTSVTITNTGYLRFISIRGNPNLHTVSISGTSYRHYNDNQRYIDLDISRNPKLVNLSLQGGDTSATSFNWITQRLYSVNISNTGITGFSASASMNRVSAFGCTGNPSLRKLDLFWLQYETKVLYLDNNPLLNFVNLASLCGQGEKTLPNYSSGRYGNHGFHLYLANCPALTSCLYKKGYLIRSPTPVTTNNVGMNGTGLWLPQQGDTFTLQIQPQLIDIRNCGFTQTDLTTLYGGLSGGPFIFAQSNYATATNLGGVHDALGFTGNPKQGFFPRGGLTARNPFIPNRLRTVRRNEEPKYNPDTDAGLWVTSYPTPLTKSIFIVGNPGATLSIPSFNAQAKVKGGSSTRTVFGDVTQPLITYSGYTANNVIKWPNFE